MINHISRVSIVAMAMPVAAIIVLLAVFNGLESKVRNLYRAIDADIIITETILPGEIGPISPACATVIKRMLDDAPRIIGRIRIGRESTYG